MSKTNIFILIIYAFLCFSCGESYEVDELYKQQIPNSSKVIYCFDAWSKYNDSHKSGCAILDSTEEFKISKIEELPSSYFDGKPSIEKIKLINVTSSYENPPTQKDTLLNPKKHYFRKFNGLDVEITEYNKTYGSGSIDTGLKIYNFEKFIESKDSLTFYDIEYKTGEKLSQKTAFPKGNIKIVEDNNGKIIYVRIEQFINKKGAIYKPTKPLELVKNQPIIGFATYEFHPKKTINSRELTNIGIYKKVKK
jgi:hypothetical protein